MDWITYRTGECRYQARSCWHYWFAWRPVTLHTYPDGAEKVIWLKTVLRKGTLIYNRYGSVWTWEYKIK